MTLVRLGVIVGIVLAGLIVAGCGRAAVPTPPVIHETFTQLACPKHANSTVAMEGCAEKSILASDERINGLVRTIFYSLGRSSRATFVHGEQSWLHYRQSSCTTAASLYTGGSIQPVFFGECLASLNASHLKDLGRLRCDVLPQDRWPASCTKPGH